MRPVADMMGANNSKLLDATKEIAARVYKDSRLIMVTPTRGDMKLKCSCGKEYNISMGIHPNVVMAWLSLMMPLNSKYYRLMISNAPVDEAYNAAVKFILEHEELRQWKYMVTIEDDVLLQPDALLKIVETAKEGDWDAVSGICWMKKDDPTPMIYGHPEHDDWEALIPEENTVMPCNGMGMGFTLFNLDMFRDGKIERPFFKTVEEWDGETRKFDTQDMYFFRKAKMAGYKVCVDTRIKLGHLDVETGKVY